MPLVTFRISFYCIRHMLTQQSSFRIICKECQCLLRFTGSKGAATYGGYALSGAVAAIYRVTVQVTGPRNSKSYIQTVLF